MKTDPVAFVLELPFQLRGPATMGKSREADEEAFALSIRDMRGRRSTKRQSDEMSREHHFSLGMLDVIQSI